MIGKQKLDRYEMHKYWGKKPAFGLAPLINTYSKKGDLLLDPFAGYGVFCSEAYLAGRNVIVNDLNSIANFISSNLFEENVNLSQIRKQWEKIKELFLPFVKKWYACPYYDNNQLPISILRDDKHRPLKMKYADRTSQDVIFESVIFSALMQMRKITDFTTEL